MSDEKPFFPPSTPYKAPDPQHPTPAAPAGGEWRANEGEIIKTGHPEVSHWCSPLPDDEFAHYLNVLESDNAALTADLAAARARIEELEAALTEEKHLHEVNLNRAGAWAAKAGLYSAEAERLRAALKKFMTLADEEWEDWLFESEGHEYEPEEWSLARIALTGQQEQGGEGR